MVFDPVSVPLPREPRALAGFMVSVLACLILLAGCGAPGHAVSAIGRPAAWAVPLEVPGLENLHKVSDTLYRSGQPTAEGLKNAGALGIGTVISLRSEQKDEAPARGTRLVLVHVGMRAWNPRYEDAVRVMRLLRPDNPALQGRAVLIHCYHGADRTGMMIALYRMVYQDWPREEALREMLEGGYGYHAMWKEIIRFIQKVNVEALRRDAAL